ncbi:hypothetical protein [Streptomyces sp. TS71-3]|uniref:hypothetical protein n=1 Tax=Streptomyces sp. TS71-3 TaxID=2733862 RepID=UPI001B0B7BA3|nr:hypothetical protein [Streptomyces sp. TS71-3]GHJ34474.1 hypothetical protein Sm713_00830 [Streptomyces sp. TS71-3]
MSKESAEQPSQGDQPTPQEEPQQDNQQGTVDHREMLAKLHEVNDRTEARGALYGGP